MIRSKFGKFFRGIYLFAGDMARDRIGVYAAQASFFIVLSIFPFVLLVLKVLAYTAFDRSYVTNLIDTYIPHSINPILIRVVNELYEHPTGTFVSVTAVVAVWSASKGIHSVMSGLYEIFHLHHRHHYPVSRLISMVYTIFFVLIIVLAMLLLVFGNRLFHLAAVKIPGLREVSLVLHIIRFSVSFLVLTFFFVLVFKMIHLKSAKISLLVPGAVLSSLGWTVFSYVFSVYVDHFSKMSYMYGSFTGFVLFMLWIYFCIYILFLGAEVNKKNIVRLNQEKS